MTHESEHSQLPWEHCTELCLYIERVLELILVTKDIGTGLENAFLICSQDQQLRTLNKMLMLHP
jgi:hypothetical protein